MKNLKLLLKIRKKQALPGLVNGKATALIFICVLTGLLITQQGYTQSTYKNNEGHHFFADQNNNDQNDANSDFIFGFNATNTGSGDFVRAMTIKDGTGRVGIGTASPSTRLHIRGGNDAALDSHGYLMMGSATSKNVIIDDNEIMARNNGAKSTLYLQGDGGDFQVNTGAEIFAFGDNGYLGIGTFTPKQKLHNTGDYYGKGHIWLHAFEGDGYDGTAYLQARDDSGNSSIGMQIRTQNAGNFVDALKINSNGNVGVGTDNPVTTLDVNGKSHFGDHVGIGTTNLTSQLSLGEWNVGNSGSGVDGSTQLLLSGTHNDGVNNGGNGSGTYKLKIEGYDNDGSTIYPIYIMDENKLVDFSIKNRATSSGDPILYFAGKMGIGTDIPTEKLDVVGTVKATSFVSSASSFPDYVFEEGYPVMPLTELEVYVAQHKHLPNMPNEQEVIAQGLNLPKVVTQSVENIETIYLHLIQLSKEIQILKQENAVLKQQIGK